MKTENKKKSQKKIQIKGKMPLSVHFFRDAEADALNMERCQLDKATLIACAVKRLREDLGNVPDSYKHQRRWRWTMDLACSTLRSQLINIMVKWNIRLRMMSLR